MLNCPCKMNKQLLNVLAFIVTCATAWSVQAQEIMGDSQAGAKKNAMCIGCHGIVGYHASFPEVHKVPKIAGQSAKLHQFGLWRSTRRVSASVLPCAGG